MTYSIVARDPGTGELGAAVQSHWFSVGPIVPWARPGVGAAVTQANAEVSYGPRLLDLLASGLGATAALQRALAEDPQAQSRQVAVVDSSGAVAAHTGERCIPHAGHAIGEEFSCQANIMVSDRVWPHMPEGFEAARGSLAERLLAALDAAEAAGGDARGRQSAALLVVPADGEPWRTQVRLHVEDHPEPLRELRRLFDLHRAYVFAGRGDELAGQGAHDEAARMYRRAGELAPENHELRFWSGLGAAQGGDMETALSEVRSAIEAHPPWRQLLESLPPEIAPSAAAILARLNGGE